MPILTFTDEHPSPIAPRKLFKALVLDSHINIPKIMPQVVKSIELIQGDGGAGSIEQVNFAEGNPVRYVRNRIDEQNEETLTYNYTMIEGDADALRDKLDCICYEIKFEEGPDGGSINKMVSKYRVKEGVTITEEEIKTSKEKTLAFNKMIEAHLIQNPNLCA